MVASVGCIYVVEAVEGRERHASLNRKDTTAEDVEAIVVPAALANSVAFPVMQLCKERGAVAVSLSIIWAVDLVECRFSQQVAQS